MNTYEYVLVLYTIGTYLLSYLFLSVVYSLRILSFCTVEEVDDGLFGWRKSGGLKDEKMNMS